MEIAVKKKMAGPAVLTCELRRLPGLKGIYQEKPAGRELRFIFATAGLDNNFAHDRRTPENGKGRRNSLRPYQPEISRKN